MTDLIIYLLSDREGRLALISLTSACKCNRLLMVFAVNAVYMKFLSGSIEPTEPCTIVARLEGVKGKKKNKKTANHSEKSA